MKLNNTEVTFKGMGHEWGQSCGENLAAQLMIEKRKCMSEEHLRDENLRVYMNLAGHLNLEGFLNMTVWK